MSTEGEKKTVRMVVPDTQSQLIGELTTTRKHLRDVIAAGKKYLEESLQVGSSGGRFSHGARNNFLEALIDAEKFLLVFVVLLVPRFLFW